MSEELYNHIYDKRREVPLSKLDGSPAQGEENYTIETDGKRVKHNNQRCFMFLVFQLK